MTSASPTVFVVDDDAAFVKAVKRLLLAAEFQVLVFPAQMNSSRNTTEDAGLSDP